MAPGESIDPRRMDCPECGKRPIRTKGLCQACYVRARRAANPEVAERDRAMARAWKVAHPTEVRRLEDSYRGTCACGAQTVRGGSRCDACRREAQRARYPEIERRWKTGESLREIAAAFDTTVDSIGVTVHRMRRSGWDLPYRYAAVRERNAA